MLRVLNRFGKIRILLAFALCGFFMVGCENSSSSSNSSTPVDSSSPANSSSPADSSDSADSYRPADFASGFGDNDPNVVLALGDSITEGSAISGPSFPQIVAGMSGKSVINAGVGGTMSIDGLNEIGELLAQNKPGYVFILFGVNDLIHVGDYGWTIDNLRQMIRIAKQNNTRPIVGTIPPRYRGDGVTNAMHQRLNRLIRALCKDEKAQLADVEKEFGSDTTLIQEDGMHPTEEGNLIVATVFYEALR